MNLSTWSIRQPVPPIAIFLVLLIVGLVSFNRLPITAMPTVDLPLIDVTVAQQGAGPSELVSQVARPIEDAVYSIPDVRHITTTTLDGAVNMVVEFELEADSDRALNDVKDAISGVRSDLPGSILEPIVRRIDVTSMPILTYAVSDQTSTVSELSDFVDDVIGRELSTVPGVGQVNRIGGADREISVELDPSRLLALGLTAADVSQQLRARNIDMGGGRGDVSGREYSIRALGAADTVAQLAGSAIEIGGGRTVRLDQLGTVVDGASEQRNFALLNGRPVVAFGVFRAVGASDLLAGDGVKEKLADIAVRYPNAQITLIDDATTYTEQSYETAMHTLYEGAGLAIVVVLLFLRNWRATLVAAAALPLSVIPTFFVMDLLGFSLNGISLLGITLVTGILVDDAIVEIENIVRHIHMGTPPYEAAIEAANEIGTTVIAISFSIVAVFAPVGFMSGVAGEYFRQFGLTVAVAVLFSLLTARIITPMMAAYLIRGGRAEEERDGAMMRGLMGTLRWTMRHRFLTLLMGLGIFAGSIFSATLLPTEFLAAADQGRSQIQVELPPGSTIEQTETVARHLTDRISDVPEVQTVFVQASPDNVSEARMMVNYGRSDTRERTQFEIEEQLKHDLSDVPDVRLNFQNEAGGNDLSVSVLADTEDGAAEAADLLVAEMRKLPTLEGVRSSSAMRRPEIQITPKDEIAAQLGVSASSLAQTLLVATLGDSESNLAKFNAGDEQIPIVVRLNEAARNDLQQVQNLRVPSAAGQVPLAVVADVSLSAGPTQIERYDRRYRTSVSANLADGAVLGPAAAQVQALQDSLDLPPGTEFQSSGDAEIMAEVFSSFALAMAAGVLLVYVVLVLLFHSFITPISILLSLPLAIGGAILALYIFDFAIGMPVVIGFLMLMGIVTKNAIMLVEFALQAMSDGVPKRDAILDAVHKRARPIIMTTIAMAAGMLPSALSQGDGSEFRSPMAVAVIGGLLLSTLLSLLFVPSLFSLLDGMQDRLGRVLRQLIGVNSERKAPAE
ncbi:efflux RND transporter permease subunit [Paracoccus aeridis]|uniref:efflux RND transporter permease subunit n=1 Tax=Paracoccus aeridis TaxID=1966466 RepID=UPI0010AAEA7F|nr:efflux RND transporter permease subunit [Paracoccus aeridis]